MSARFSADEAAQWLSRVDLLHERGEDKACIEQLHSLNATLGHDQPRLLQDIGLRFTALELHADAEACFARALEMAADNSEYIYNHATALIALGRLAEAEAAFDRVIALSPSDSAAWYNRATLRKQTVQLNHVAQIEQALAGLTAPASGEMALCYALAKELEDLGEHARSFAALKRGADLRRRGLAYRVADDVETMGLIGDIFDAHFIAGQHVGHSDPRPLFVVGLPRSGSTLVDRILSSHSAITSRGESNDLALSMMRAAGPATSKQDLVRRSTQLDFAALGKSYTANLGEGPALRLIDKTPANFLYLGLVAAALPQARIVHIRRQPMDACYAMYKTLFRMAYPFSYDLGDLAQYWLAYDRLMAQWRQVLPAEQFLEVDYEDLVRNQEKVSRQLIAHVNLPWEDACLAFEKNPQASLTASAAQVRQPMYRSSIGLWRRYATELRPLYEQLRAAGVAVDDESNEALS